MIFFALDIAPAYLDQAVLVWCIFFGLLPFAISSFKNQNWEKLKFFLVIHSALLVAFYYYYRLYRFSVNRIDEFWAIIVGSEELMQNPFRSGFEVFIEFALYAVPLSILSFLLGLFVLWCSKFLRKRKHKYRA